MVSLQIACIPHLKITIRIPPYEGFCPNFDWRQDESSDAAGAGVVSSVAGRTGSHVGRQFRYQISPLFRSEDTRFDAVTTAQPFFFLSLPTRRRNNSLSLQFSARPQHLFFKMASEKAPLPFGYTFMAGKLVAPPGSKLQMCALWSLSLR